VQLMPTKSIAADMEHMNDPLQLKDPLDIHTTAPNQHAAASSLLSLLYYTDFNTENEWTLNEKSDDDYYDDELFQDDPGDNLEEDMSYYQVSNTGKVGHPLSAGGVSQPDTSGMTQAKAKDAMRHGHEELCAKHIQTRWNGSRERGHQWDPLN
jgi:hypothetical protein